MLPLCHSSNSIGYISRPISARSFCIASASGSTSPLPAVPGCSIPRRQEACFLCFPTRACQETVSCCSGRPLSLPRTCLPRRRQVATSQVHPVPAFVATSIVFIYFNASGGAVSCSCEPELPSCTRLPVGTGRPCSMVGIILCGESPCSIELALATWCHSIK